MFIEARIVGFGLRSWTRRIFVVADDWLLLRYGWGNPDTTASGLVVDFVAGHIDIGEFGARNGVAAVTIVFEVVVDADVGSVTVSFDTDAIGTSSVVIASANHLEMEGFSVNGFAV